ncbi:hypothetical protein O3M35_000770 [Rhynocoris fuscipes]|uniref:Uncharacterized protein n=1 Tax=Rhynocoris fuscipes TaxID=488301 RepID=A0AAW1DQ50_9HEMI
MWILDNFDIHHIRHINSGDITAGDANKLGGYYNSKYNEENLPGFDIKNVLFNPPKTKDVGKTTVAHFKKKVIGSRSRFVIKWNSKCDTIDASDINKGTILLVKWYVKCNHYCESSNYMTGNAINLRKMLAEQKTQNRPPSCLLGPLFDAEEDAGNHILCQIFNVKFSLKKYVAFEFYGKKPV